MDSADEYYSDEITSGQDDSDDDRCVDCELSNCDGTGDACPCNYECH